MHIVAIAWLFVIAMMALALSQPLAGAAFFIGVGLAPVALAAWVAVRSQRGRAANASMLEQQVHAADDRHAKADH
ncbi:MAG: hypothetical protein ABI624_23340 [Casimicrobiaceae bacterium]